MSSQKMRKYLKIIAINLLVFLMFIAVLEGIAYLWTDKINLTGTDDALIQDDRYGDTFGLKPGAEGFSSGAYYYVDSWGFWEHERPKKIDTTSWLLLGDSVTMGVGITADSTFAGLWHNRQDSVNILNSGVIGYASENYVDITKSLLSENEFNIEKAILFWTLNDIYSQAPGDDYPGQDMQLVSRVKTFFRQNFRFYHLLKGLFFDRSKTYYQYDKQFYRSDEELFIKAVQNVKSVARIAGENDIPLYIYLLPYEYQLREKGGFGPQRVFRKELENKGISGRRIFNCDSFFESDVSEDYYLYGDGMHFSKQGHRAVYNCIQKTMR